MLEQLLYDAFITEFHASRLRQIDLSRRTGMSPKHINQVIKRHVHLTVDAADRLMTALGRQWTIGTHPNPPAGPGR